MASTTTTKKQPTKAAASKTSTRAKSGTSKPAPKKNTVRQIDVIAKVITDLGGKAKLADVAKVVETKKLIPNLGPYTYRKLYGIILRDKGKTVAKAGKGEFKVVTKKS